MKCRMVKLALVPVLAHDSCSGRAEWKLTGIDACLVDEVNELTGSGALTRTCCCGHGKRRGEIRLQDGTKLFYLTCKRKACK